VSTEPATDSHRFAFRIDSWMRPFMLVMGGVSSNCYVDVTNQFVVVNFGVLGFRARINREHIASSMQAPNAYGGWGVHGFWGTWLVNGSSRGIVQLILEPKCRAWLLGIVPLHVRTLSMSLQDPEGFIAALHSS